MHAEHPARGRLLISALLLGGGCVGAPGVERLAPVPSSHPYHADIPLPAGFALVDQSSEDWSSGPLRYLRHRYQGRGDKHAVREFYRQQMPLVRWAPVQESSMYGRCRMLFARGLESCAVTIEQPGSRRSRAVTVDVLITPKPR